MHEYDTIVEEYLDHCINQKRLSQKTVNAYRIDLTQFQKRMALQHLLTITQDDLEEYIKNLHAKYKPKTVKRKVASMKAFLRYAEYHGIICSNPFTRIQSKFREPQTIPRIIPLAHVQQILRFVYGQIVDGRTMYRRRNAIRDAAICELLFATGVRVFELCSLSPNDFNFGENTVFIHGKGAKERMLHIGNPQVHNALINYKQNYTKEISMCNHFFVNQKGRPFSDQSVRRMLNHYTSLMNMEQHITPHMWRHTFATALLDAEVDIRYIQVMLGHSSIQTTQIYTHVSMAKQRDILCKKHPRCSFTI